MGSELIYVDNVNTNLVSAELAHNVGYVANVPLRYVASVGKLVIRQCHLSFNREP